MMKTLICALLLLPALSQHNDVRADFERLQATKTAVTPVSKATVARSYAQECWTKAHLPIRHNKTALLQEMNVPGAGIDKFEPFEKVLKDGFLKVKCAKDYMYYRGDKFGDNKHDYKLGPVSGVSIVHYDAFVAKEDRAEMTQKICFEFCRTVPNMGFFGIVNGRGCYCTPYFVPMESDSSLCDAVCEGDNTNTCGGKSKSDIFAMHMCDSTKEDLGARSAKASAMADFMDDTVKKASEQSDHMQNIGEKLQKAFGNVGDSGASGLLQSAKQFAGDLVHKAEEVEVQASKLHDLAAEEAKLKDFSDPATVTKAERVMEGIDETAEKGDGVLDELLVLEAHAAGMPEPRKGFEEAAEDKAASPSGTTSIKKLAENTWVATGKGLGGGYTSLEEGAAAVLADPACQGGVFDFGEGYAYCATSLPHTTMPGPMGYALYKVEMTKKQEKEHPKPSIQYYPVMYFVDKEFEKVPSTCSGDLVGEPIVGQDQTTDLCAAACDAYIHECVGFQYFKDGENSLCFLFSRFNTGFYYTGCGKAFLQTSSPSTEAGCYAKLSKFEGTTLKPNPSGKCKQCFKELTKADRCYE